MFDRFPTMQTMILEAGVGWLPSMFERFEEHREMFGRIKAPEWKTPPMEIFLRQMMVTVEACEETDLRIALEFLPADHVALASDWPHYDGTPDLLDGLPEGGGRGRHRSRPMRRCSPRERSRSGSRRTERRVDDLRAGGQRRSGAGRARRWCAATRRLTYGELDGWVNRVAHVLAARGLGPGGRVAMLLPNGPEFLAVTHAAAKLGALAVPIN